MPKEAPVNVLEQIKKLQEQQATLMETAKKELLEKINGGITELNALGFAYVLTEDGKKKKVKTADFKECDLCPFSTVPPHSRRHHKTQKDKKAFTAKELEEKGWTKK